MMEVKVEDMKSFSSYMISEEYYFPAHYLPTVVVYSITNNAGKSTGFIILTYVSQSWT